MTRNTIASLAALAVLAGATNVADAQTPGAPERWAKDGSGGSPDFTRHIVPLLGKAGCNNRACHGSFRGQNGFKLSLFGFEPAEDHKALLEDVKGKGPRADVKLPDASMLLRKPTVQRPHRGGERFDVDSWEYRMLRQWIADGARYDPKKAARLERLEVTPREAVLRGKDKISLRTLAHFSDGTSEDVTALTLFKTNDPGTATVTDAGEVAAVRTGNTAVIAQYGGGVASTQVLVPYAGDKVAFPAFPPHNRVDEMVLAQLRKLNVRPADLCSDEEFLRRVYIDVIGTLPTAAEARKFLKDDDPAKRARLIDHLLDRPEYAQYWGMKFSDWTGNGYVINPPQPNWMWQAWLEDKLNRNLPYDEVVRGILCATTMEGRSREETWAETQAINHKNEGRGEFEYETYARRKTLDLYWLKSAHTDPAIAALQTANAFLGVRLECAQCHNHPLDRWTQKDYESFKSFFMFVRFTNPKSGKEREDSGLVGYGRISIEPGVSSRWAGVVKKTPPKLLAGPVVDAARKDPRQALWEWMKSPDNEHFAPSLVNRYWAHYLGRGLVHPVDDFNQGNPPSNPALLAWLARYFIEHKFDLKHLQRTILNSRTYQLSWRPNPSSKFDSTNYSRALVRRLEAEVLMDAVAEVTGVPDPYAWVPKGRDKRAVGQAGAPFLHSFQRAGYAMAIFGRPGRERTCDCERTNEPSLAQALYLINDEQMHAKLTSPKGRLPRMLKEMRDDRALIEELYLTALSRYPTANELKTFVDHVANAPSRQAGMQDVLWSLLNVREFLFNH